MINKARKTNNNWSKDKNKINEKENDDKALFWHYEKHHKSVITSTTQLSDAYRVAFVERPSRSNLNVVENSCIERGYAKINKARTYT